MKSVWEHQAADELRAMLRDAGMTYRELSDALGIDGVNAQSLLKRIYRGAFTHAFFLQCKEALNSRIEKGSARRSE